MAHPQQRLLSQLASSPNDIASGLGQCLEALRLISALPRTSPVFVHYISAPSPTVKAFGREHLSRVPLRTVITLIKSSLSLTDSIRVTTALFYREDGSVDPTPALVDEDSWKGLAPYVHTLHVEDDREHDICSTTSLSGVSSLSAISATTAVGIGIGNGFAATPSSPPAPANASKASVLNSNASAFVPSPNGITIKTNESGKTIHLQVRKSSAPLSPTCDITVCHFG